MSNPKLDKLIISLIGNKFYDDAQELEKLSNYVEDEKVLESLEKIKLENKQKFCKYIKKSL